LVREHKPELLAHLAPEPAPPPLTNDERAALRKAIDERAAILEYDGGLSRADADAVAALHRRYLEHLMGPGKRTGCCHAPAGRLCAEGRRLRDIYTAAAASRHPEEPQRPAAWPAPTRAAR
jgi:hypothetical protein